MADEEQVERVLKGAVGWNWWCRENPKLKIDLEGADLRRANLNAAVLDRADLVRGDGEDTGKKT